MRDKFAVPNFSVEKNYWVFSPALIRMKFGMHMHLVVLYAASAAALLILPVIVSYYGDSDLDLAYLVLFPVA